MVDPALLYQDVPMGFGFRPTDKELVDHYLRHKLLGDDPSTHNTIPEIDICKYEPWDLPAFSLIKSDDPEWFFFSRRDYKYSNGTRSNRATPCGCWKATGKDSKIKDPVTNNVIGTKKTLIFCQRRVPHVPHIRNNWRTHVLNKLLKRPGKKIKEKVNELVFYNSEPSDRIAAEHENQANLCRTLPEVHYGSDMDSLTQTPLESNDFVGSTIQTSSEVNSTVDTPHDELEDLNDFINSLLVFSSDFGLV